MTRSELEELISAYIDNELSAAVRRKVEVFVRSNLQAKAILDEYLEVRKIVKLGVESTNYSVPANFSNSVMQAIEKQSATQTGEKQSARSENNAFTAVPKSSIYAVSGNGFLSRLRNVRIFTYPLIIVAVAITVSFYGIQRDKSGITNNNGSSGNQIALNIEPSVPTANITDVTKETPNNVQTFEDETDRIQAPLPSSDAVSGDATVKADDTLVLECSVEKEKFSASLFPRIFAAKKIEWKQTTGGKSGQTIYEFNADAKTINELTQELPKHNVIVSVESLNSLENLTKTDKSDNIKVRIVCDK